VARLAESLKIGLIIRATFVEGEFVVDFGCGDKATSIKAKLAERMLLDIQVADRYPLATVKLAVGWTVGLVVFTGGDGFMFRAVTLGCKVRASWVCARVWCFGWHRITSLRTGMSGITAISAPYILFIFFTLFIIANHMT